jgi:ABC-type Mn2+/Zn2+ transport system permease subunit
VHRRGRVSLDTSIGVLFTAAFALGIFLMSRSTRATVDLSNYLFGNILGVSSSDVGVVVGVGIAIAIVVGALWRPLLYTSFDPIVAEAAGVRAWFIDYALLVILALTIIVSVQLVGIVLVAALLVTPAAAAAQLTVRFVPMMLLSCVFGIVSAIGGLYASYELHASSGATIVLLATLIFFAALAINARRRRRLVL